MRPTAASVVDLVQGSELRSSPIWAGRAWAAGLARGLCQARAPGDNRSRTRPGACPRNSTGIRTSPAPSGTSVAPADRGGRVWRTSRHEEDNPSSIPVPCLRRCRPPSPRNPAERRAPPPAGPHTPRPGPRRRPGTSPKAKTQAPSPRSAPARSFPIGWHPRGAPFPPRDARGPRPRAGSRSRATRPRAAATGRDSGI